LIRAKQGENMHLTKIKINGLHGQLDIEHNLVKGLNIIYARNGSGKTTLLHIIANLLNNDIGQFLYIEFDSIEMTFSDNSKVVLEIRTRFMSDGHKHWDISVNGKPAHYTDQDGNKSTQAIGICENALNLDHYKNNYPQKLGLKSDSLFELKSFYQKTAYFPAFRIALDAMMLQSPHFSHLQLDKTSQARRLFGPFVSKVDYPGIEEIEAALDEAVAIAASTVADADRKIRLSVYTSIAKTMSKHGKKQAVEESDSVLEEVDKLAEGLLPVVPRISAETNGFKRSLKNLPEETKLILAKGFLENLREIKYLETESFRSLHKFLSSINGFFHEKSLQIDRGDKEHAASLFIEIAGKAFKGEPLHERLSSGECQLLTLLFSTSFLEDEAIVLVDEPEISLHIDWQRSLLKAFMNQMGQKQLIVCTHSPVLAAGHENRSAELKVTRRNR